MNKNHINNTFKTQLYDISLRTPNSQMSRLHKEIKYVQMNHILLTVSKSCDIIYIVLQKHKVCTHDA